MINNSIKNNPFEGKFDSSFFWCRKCNLPLLEEMCAICREKGIKLNLSPPGDVRFASPHEKKIMDDLILEFFGENPIADKLILLNKIPGEDKTDEIIVDGFHFGILRFDMSELAFKLDLMVEGACALIDSGINKKIIRISSGGRHLSGKNIDGNEVIECSDDIVKGDTVLVTGKNLCGFGIAYRDSSELKYPGQSLKIRKIGSGKVTLLPGKPVIEDVIRANAPHMKQLVKDAVNTIRGIANQADFRDTPVYVSFSGGKDSLVTLDLTRSAVKKPIKVFFANTGIEFPETVDFARRFCRENDIELIEVKVNEAFWENLPSFGPPAKDFRWCCKVCKLAPINSVLEECTSRGKKCLTIDGKRRFESFTRSRIAPKEENPFIPGQISVFPIRNWRAIEVWLYIFYGKLEYNPLYDEGFERVGCWLCPAELSAEYYRFSQLHPLLFTRWNEYLLKWGKEHGLDEAFIKHGFWRWKTLPPKMLRLADELKISTKSRTPEEEFGITVTGGVSPCRTGGYTMEGKITGLLSREVQNIANILGENTFSEDLGVVLIHTKGGNVKIFSSGHISVNAPGKEDAGSIFENTAKQLIRVKKCTKCRVCLKVCPVNAIVLEPDLKIGKVCTRCGKCTESCVVVKYFDRILPDFKY
ncbi:MAG: phosphoadenosine phosphosulfate reductase [Candidatus Methanoperedenaceae archaeon]|nr:MAG: phosphoadenosine phosphosulfate reductase [Candidatus Methanoperedenaceae archaeon]